MTSENKKLKVAVGLSGGVDSAVSAYLLKKAGYDVTGVYILCWDNKGDGCTADEDRSYAVQNASHLGIDFLQLDFRDVYKQKVMDYFFAEYKAGRTPNPDVMCNKEIKFGLFYDWAMTHGFDKVATGHYARVDTEGEITILRTGVDTGKDQSYFLYLLTSEHLAHTLFPVGSMKKPEVRKIAEEAALPSYKRPESMGICFVGEVDIKEFLKKQIIPQEGNVLDTHGNIIGTHDGAWFYTVGQRHGFTVKNYTGVPLYIVSKNVGTNELVVGSREDASVSEFRIGNSHWISFDPFKDLNEIDCHIRIRHLGDMVQAKVTKNADHSYTINLSDPMFAVAPGQSAVLYQGDIVLGGGVVL